MEEATRSVFIKRSFLISLKNTCMLKATKFLSTTERCKSNLASPPQEFI